MVDSEHRNTAASSRRVSTSGRASRRARTSFIMDETYRLRAAARPRTAGVRRDWAPAESSIRGALQEEGGRWGHVLLANGHAGADQEVAFVAVAADRSARQDRSRGPDGPRMTPGGPESCSESAGSPPQPNAPRLCLGLGPERPLARRPAGRRCEPRRVSRTHRSDWPRFCDRRAGRRRTARRPRCRRIVNGRAAHPPTVSASTR